MDKRTIIILVAGIVLCAILFLTDIYLGGIALIIFATLGMSFFIMQDSKSLPEIGVVLEDDAKRIVVINRGNDAAYKIHVALVPHNIEFDIASLGADARYDLSLGAMLAEAKAVVTYQNAQGVEYSRTTMLSALGKSDDDLMKPMFPIFRWK